MAAGGPKGRKARESARTASSDPTVALSRSDLRDQQKPPEAADVSELTFAPVGTVFLRWQQRWSLPALRSEGVAHEGRQEGQGRNVFGASTEASDADSLTR